MLAQLGTILAAVRSVVETLFGIRFRILAGMTLTAAVLAGCLPATVPSTGADPADPSAKVAGVGYRPTVTLYISMRPATPSSWGEPNDRVAPAPKSDR